MLPINSLLSLDGYSWTLPTASGVIPQGHPNFTYASALHHSQELAPFEGPHSVTARSSRDADTFGNSHQHYDLQEHVTTSGGMDTQHHREPSPGHPSPPATTTRRARYGNMNWESRKEELKQLYLTEDKTLDETMRIMNEKYSIPESYVSLHLY